MYEDEPIECAVCGALIGPDEEHTSKDCTRVIRERWAPQVIPVVHASKRLAVR